jgi:hypothetical protein
MIVIIARKINEPPIKNPQMFAFVRFFFKVSKIPPFQCGNIAENPIEATMTCAPNKKLKTDVITMEMFIINKFVNEVCICKTTNKKD